MTLLPEFRTWTDRSGVEWSARVIHPERVERRDSERRTQDAGPPRGTVERRRARDRRLVRQRRVRLDPQWADGWLLLVSSTGMRRRVAPIPANWQSLSQTALELLTRLGDAEPGDEE